MIALNQIQGLAALIMLVATLTAYLGNAFAHHEKIKQRPSIILFDVFRFSAIGSVWSAMTGFALCVEPRMFYDDYVHLSTSQHFLILGWLIALLLFYFARRQEFYGTHPLQRRTPPPSRP